MQKVYEILIKGKGGHASTPQQANNPILIAAGLIQQLGVIPAAVSEHQKEATVTITEVEAGDKGNIIPEQAKVQLRICAEEEEDLLKAQERYLGFGRKFIEARNAEAVIYEI